jgi:sec-independent protein translocase protein TatB
MFGLSVEHIVILLCAALFIFGPERLPGAVAWLGSTLRKSRDYVTSARSHLDSEIGPEFDELREQLRKLNTLSGFNPRATASHYLNEVVTVAENQPQTSAVPTIDLDAT